MHDDIIWDCIKIAYVEGSYKYMLLYNRKYKWFCKLFSLTPFPCDQWKLVWYAVYFSF